jgi:hypothetical protein
LLLGPAPLAPVPIAPLRAAALTRIGIEHKKVLGIPTLVIIMRRTMGGRMGHIIMIRILAPVIMATRNGIEAEPKVDLAVFKI